MRAILTFHSIDDSGSVLAYSPHLFSSLLQQLGEQGIPVLDLDTLLAPATEHGVAITFDDGMQSVHRHALPLLQEHNAPAHLFVTTGAIGTDTPWPQDPYDGHTFNMLSWHELEALQAGGVRIESHTHSHPDMRTLPVERMDAECEQADSLIEQRFGRRPRYFAYPYGYHDRTVRAFASQRYAGTVTTELRSLDTDNDKAALPRLDSYYLQTPGMIRNLDSLRVRSYLTVRNILRNWRGSQCRANCD